MKKLLPLFAFLFAMAASLSQANAQSDLVITAVFDGNLPGQLPKGVELYVINDIPDMSVYGLGSANNGQGTDGLEFTFPEDSHPAGTYLYVATEIPQFTSFFGFAPQYTSGVVNINGDDAIELFLNEEVVDVFGEIEYDPFDGSWSYLNGWAYRIDATGPDGSNYTPSHWLFSGTGALSGVETNSAADIPIPVGTYSPVEITVPILSFVTTILAVGEEDGTIEVGVGITNPDPDNATSVEVVVTGGSAIDGLDYEMESPQTIIFVAGATEPQTFSIDIIDNEEEDGDRTIELALQNPNNEGVIGMGEMMITIVDDNFTIPLYDIAELRESDTDLMPILLGDLVEARGVVHGINMRPQGLGFTLIDPTGGIAIYRDSENLSYEVQEGDSVHVIGNVDFFSGMAQIEVESVILIEEDRPIFDPLPVNELNESTESNVVRLNCVSLVDSTQWEASGSGFNVEVSDGLNNYQVRIASPVLDLYNAAPPSGILHISGIGGQFDNSAPYNTGYQLLPRYAADVEEAGKECVTSTLAHQQIELLVYPNPVNDIITVSGNTKIYDIRIVDLSGKMVKQFSETVNRSVQFDVTDLPSGMYVIQVFTESGREVKEIVKP